MATSPSRRRRRTDPASPPPPSAPCEARDWAALPHDILCDVFLRLGTCEILCGAEAVCRAWRRVAAEEPLLYRRVAVDVDEVPEWSSVDVAVSVALDRSAGRCEAFSGPWDDESLLYLAERAPSLRSLHLSDAYDDDVTYEALIEAIKKLPLLEDLEIPPTYHHISASERLFESICKARPLLNNLKIRFVMPPHFSFGEAGLEERSDGDIYRTPMMSNLRSLELLNFVYTSEQLTAILDNCPLLESLYIAGFFVDGSMDSQLRAKCARVKNLILTDLSAYSEGSDEEDSNEADSNEEDSNEADSNEEDFNEEDY